MNSYGEKKVIFTIGHSTHPLNEFIDLLRRNQITAVADVRSVPYSQFQPQFNREKIKEELKKSGIEYVFLGEELGARSKDLSNYENGKVQYRRLAQTELFRRGIERLKTGMSKHRIVVMCTEKEPLECHRTLLVARELDAEGVPVAHIHANGSTETHAEAMDRLLKTVNSSNEDMFHSRADRIARALARQEEHVAYVLEESTGNKLRETS
jgi:uncharacterized protein (DUF488 family)